MHKLEQTGVINQAGKNGRKPLFFQPKLSVNQPGNFTNMVNIAFTKKIKNIKQILNNQSL
jgi:hypothetical protein